MKKTILLLLAIILTVTMIPAEIASAVSGPDAPAEVSAKRYNYNSITVSWKSVSDAGRLQHLQGNQQKRSI